MLTTAAVYVYMNPGFLVRLFGPPKVKLEEIYAEKSTGPSFDHSLFDRLLARHVDDMGWVQYEGLREYVDDLDNYIDAIGQAPFDEMGRGEKLALLINAYNAFTLKLILEHYPVSSIRDIPASQRWDDVRWNVGGEVWSLTQMEHKQIRAKFREPRIHFALVCAAVGCPPLRNEAYVGDRLEEQLEQQAQYFHRHKTWFQLDADRHQLRLTQIYLWYSDDFRQVAGAELDYAARFSTDLRKVMSREDRPQVKWLAYDWNLNSNLNKVPR